MIYLSQCIRNISLEELGRAIMALPAWRREQALRYKHLQGQKECAFSYLLLCRALKELGMDEHPTFIYQENGKPLLAEHTDVHFNLSHCKRAVACVVSDRPVGIDVESLGRYSERLARYTMNDEEYAEICGADVPDIVFTRLWTMKEAAMKLTGDGITTNVRNVLKHSYNIIYKTVVNDEDGYVMTVAEYAQEP